MSKAKNNKIDFVNMRWDMPKPMHEAFISCKSYESLISSKEINNPDMLNQMFADAIALPKYQQAIKIAKDKQKQVA